MKPDVVLVLKVFGALIRQHFLIFEKSTQPLFNSESKEPWRLTKSTRKKTRQHNERMLNIECGSFTPVVFAVMVEMSKDCLLYVLETAVIIVAKRKESYDNIASWIRRNIRFSSLNSLQICLRGSHTINTED